MLKEDGLTAGAARPLSPEPMGLVEETAERALRPLSFSEYVGQAKTCEQLRIFIAAAKGRGEPLDHTLIYGPPGLGKTTLAHIIAREMGSTMHATSGPVLEKKGDLAALLTNLKEGDILFVDEIHRLSAAVEEVLYPAMEDFRLDLMVGEGPAACSYKIPLPPFTLIGATTRAGMLTTPLRDRFGIKAHLEFYKPDDLAEIVGRSARLLNMDMPSDATLEIARRSRGTPRVANRLLRRVRDVSDVRHAGAIDLGVVDRALGMLDVDSNGLDEFDRAYLGAVVRKFAGGPVGVDNLATAIGESADTIEDVLEPYLIQQGFVKRTSRGRMAMPLAYSYLGLPCPSRDGPSGP